MKVLIVDDNNQMQEYIKDILAISGIHVKIIQAGNGEEAIKSARIHSPNLIIMDIEMPIMDGMKALKVLKSEASTSEIPVIACTGCASAKDKGQFLNEGFDGFIPKPFMITDFMTEVNQFMQA